MDDIFLNMLSILEDGDNYNTRKVKRDKVGDYTIDTAYTSDYGYETAIWKFNNLMIIVERYDSKKESKIGHEKWCEFCKNNPKKAYSVQLDKMVKF